MESKYVYDTLNVHTREIRLLHLLPGAWHDPLRGSLRTVPLHDEPQYNGLSYAWGKVELTKEILLDGRPLEITPNLYVALRRLRRRREVFILWIDAICINQMDLKERSEQVSFMGVIYSSATQTIVWLGESIAGDADALEAAQDELNLNTEPHWELGNFEHVLEHKTFANHNEEALAAFGILHLLGGDEHWTDKPLFVADSKGQYHMAERYVPAWRSTRKLLQLPWWSRIWTLQEFVLSRKAVLVLGRVAVPWDVVFGFCESYLNHLPPGKCCHTSVTWQMTSEIWADIVFMRLALFNFYTTRSERLRLNGEVSPSAFLEYLWLLRHKHASDPRDKVYGLLGLISSNQREPPVFPNYTTSIGRAFATATEAVIRTNNDLQALAGPRLRQPGLPSWVIDLLPENDADNVLFFHNIFKRINSSVIFNACGPQGLEYTLHDDRLTVRGIRVDTVKNSAIAWKEGFTADGYLECEKQSIMGGDQTYPSGCSRMEAFWRTLVRDSIHEHAHGETFRSADVQDRPAAQLFRSSPLKQSGPRTTPHSPVPASLAPLRNSFFIARQCQDFFTTEKE